MELLEHRKIVLIGTLSPLPINTTNELHLISPGNIKLYLISLNIIKSHLTNFINSWVVI